MQKLSEETCEFTVTVAVICWVVSAPDPNADRFQYAGSDPRWGWFVMEAIRAGVGLGLGPRLLLGRFSIDHPAIPALTHLDSQEGTWYPREKLKQAERKLLGYNPAHIMRY